MENNGDGHRRKSSLQKLKEMEASQVLKILRYVNLCNALCVITAGIITVVTLGGFDITTIFVGVYISLFGCMLFCFECRLARMEADVRRNFGFLYSYTGRTAFIILLCDGPCAFNEYIVYR